MATQNPNARRILGAIIQNGHIHRAGEEDALAPLLSESDIHRLQSAGQISGDWLTAPSTDADDESDENGTDDEEQDELPALPAMEAHLAGMTDADEIRAMRKQDTRKGAKPMYKARLAALEA